MRTTPPWEGSRRKQHEPPGWRTQIRPRILARDGHRCTWVEDGRRCTARAADVDHIVNVASGGTHADSNLASLCAWHHGRKSSAEGNAARVRRSARRDAEPHPGTRSG